MLPAVTCGPARKSGIIRRSYCAWGDGFGFLKLSGFKSLVLVAVLAALFGVPSARAAQLSAAQAELYTSVSINPPNAQSMTVCYGFVCRRRASLDFSPGDRRQLTQILSSGKASAVAERAAVQKAVVWFDRRMGPVIGTTGRVANADIRAGNNAGNYDCWDTTRNVSSLLLVLQEWGLLKYHTVGNPRYRGNIFIGQLHHNTAVLVEKTSKIEWVVDMWPVKYAQVPDVMPVDTWLKEK